MERKMKRKLKMLMATGLVVAGIGSACAHVQFKLNPNVVMAKGNYAMEYYLIKQTATRADNTSDEISNGSASSIAFESAFDIKLINDTIYPYTDSFTKETKTATIGSYLKINYPTTSGVYHCALNAAQLLKASMNNQTITLPSSAYCTPG
jgi:hypothetical protein